MVVDYPISWWLLLGLKPNGKTKKLGKCKKGREPYVSAPHFPKRPDPTLLRLVGIHLKSPSFSRRSVNAFLP